MLFLAEQWFAIRVSTVIVFFVSFFAHMVLPYHKTEYKAVPNEDELLGVLKSVPPEMYMFPMPADMKAMNSPEFIEKGKTNRNGMLAIFPGPVQMGPNLGLTFLSYLAIGVFIAYVGAHSIPAGSAYLDRFRICGAVAFCSYGLGWIPFVIWFRFARFWPNMIDGVLYSLAAAGAFAWLWKG